MIKIGNKKISRNGPIFKTAEIGINHNGSVEIAKQLIDLAKICGFDAVKFQKKVPELCVPETEKNRLKETPWGEMTYLEYKKKLEFGGNEYSEINDYCKEKGIIWFASVWDVPSVEFLEKYNVPCYKIPSAHLTNKELLLKVKSLKKPIIISTGMSTEDEIKKAVMLLEGAQVMVMHCNSGYPAKDDELNLNYIKKLLKDYPDLVIGYSGHELGISATLVAAVLGAKVIERHITLDRAMWGTDHAASIEFSGMRRLSRDLDKLSVWAGDGVKKVTETEQIIKKKLRNVETL
ncbi:MAG: N-acetylneuraminate synthase family protein [Thermoplasmatales archaeon]|nr:MAG: N-acetylneuraminate synthase family protein [Thermoplasmatales archaeon]